MNSTAPPTAEDFRRVFREAAEKIAAAGGLPWFRADKVKLAGGPVKAARWEDQEASE